MLNFYTKFLRQAAGILAPLTDALKGPARSLTWSPALDSFFHRSKALLIAVPELVHPRPGAQISLEVDASNSHMGFLLQQLLDGSRAPCLSSPRSCLWLNRNTHPSTGS